MSRYEGLIDPSAIDYVLKYGVREPDILARLRQETESHPKVNFQIPPEHGQFLRVLIAVTQAKKAIEVGVFTGYSSTAVALALPPGGKLIACDVSEEYTSVARRYWAEAGVADKVDLRIAPAKETLAGLIAAGESGTFDFAFIDADKTGYAGYYEQCLALLRVGGTIALDNMLFSGRAMQPPPGDADSLALSELNRFIHRDERVESILLPFADGLTLAVKR
jgi:predicted O-methyltransferase YrrM